MDTHNSLARKYRALVAANRSDFQLYDKLIEEDKSLVAQYKALVRR